VNILALYEKLEKLVQHLPQSLQSPILREITPLKTLFFHQRAPRILLLGDRSTSRSALVNLLFGGEAAQTGEDHLQDGTWQTFAMQRGKLQVLDARRPASVASFRRVLTDNPPDVCIFLHSEPRRPEETTADLEQAQQVLQLLENAATPAKPNVLGVALGGDPGAPQEARRHLDEALHSEQRFGYSARTQGLFVPRPGEGGKLASAIAAELSGGAKLELVRLASLREEQAELARAVVKSVAAICGAVGAQPIPLADFPVLTSLQAAMVAGIMHISGRDLSMKLAGEWIGALGANLGLGLVMREGARAILKVVPVWGDLVSGGIAAAGTYAIGKAATAYFIEGATLEGAKRVLREKKKKNGKNSAGQLGGGPSESSDS
jgi:uncharacterized protein (DUF697 family)